MKDYVYLYDSTLRDGAQARGIDFTVADKNAIAKALAEFGIDYLEGGWPGANPNDDAFFANPPKMKKCRLTAFGMTRRNGRSAENDPGLQDLLQANTGSICIVGKAWAHQVETALNVSLDENQRMIEESLSYLKSQGKEVMFDAEHFFDGYKSNPEYALKIALAAQEAGARWIILCDTNGGTMPHEIETIVREVAAHIPGTSLGIHCHNDTGQAVANSMAAIRAGVRQVQGTINGIGERCGNADLITIIANLAHKTELKTGINDEKLAGLRTLSRLVDERLNRDSNAHAPYVGDSAFAHKGGLHVSAMAKDTSSYEHVHPETVGNERVVLISDKAGKSNILNRLKALGLEKEAEDERIGDLVNEIKEREKQGYAYEDADASFELLVKRRLGTVPTYFDLHSFRITAERRHNAKGELVTMSEATVKISLQDSDEVIMEVAEGNGPVNAMDAALRKALIPHHKKLKDIYLADYKVRILTPQDATAAITRVMIESADSKGRRWTTIGISANVIDASFNALHDAITFALMKK